MRLKLMEYNVQDLFLPLAYAVKPTDLEALNEAEWQLLAAPDQPMKPLAKLKGLARVFAQENPDVALLCEVGGADALAHFNRLFLGERYEPYFFRGNDERGIDS